MSGILPDIYLPSDMRALQARLLAAAQGTDESVRTCGAIDMPTRAAWGLFYIQLSDFAVEDPGTIFFGSRVDRAKELETELFAWQQKIAKSCALAVPKIDPSQDPNAPKTDAVVKAIQYASVAAIVVGGAYVVGKVVGLLPHPASAQRANPLPTRRRRKRIAA